MILYLSSDRMGTGDDELGRRLLRTFLSTLLASEKKVDRIVCVNAGVFLTTEGTHVREELADFARQGTTITSCLTCLKHYQREDELVIGTKGDMAGTVAALTSGETIVRP